MEGFLGEENESGLRFKMVPDSAKSAWRHDRESTINWIRDLDRDGLRHKEREKCVFMHITALGERLYIQYPGKEAEIEGAKKREWDFRPKLIKADGSLCKDMSFQAIWDMFENLEDSENWVKRALAVFFVRMAFMCDHVLGGPVFRTAFVGGIAKEETAEDPWRDEELGQVLQYRPQKNIVEELAVRMPDFNGMSLEALLHYNDLLAWNEDCKYFYRDCVLGSKRWHGKVGRVNNLLTHVKIIGWLTKDISLSNLLSSFTWGGGVAAASPEEIRIITGGLVS